MPGLSCERIKLPPSVQVMTLLDDRPDTWTALLYQCPNLTEVRMTMKLLDSSTTFAAPLTLNCLETLSWSARLTSTDFPSIQNLHLPTLKHLRLNFGFGAQPKPIVTFCGQVSQTLVSLELGFFSDWGAGDFRQLFRHKFLRLENLKLAQSPLSQLLMATRALTPSDEEFRRKEVPLPCLQHLVMKSMNIDSDDDARVLDQFYPRPTNLISCILNLFLKMLKERRAGKSNPFHLDFPEIWDEERKLQWTASLQDGVRRAIGGRDVRVLQEGRILSWL